MQIDCTAADFKKEVKMANELTLYSSVFIMNTPIKPAEFLNYLRYYGPHFNKKLCDFACKQLPKREYSKEKLDILL